MGLEVEIERVFRRVVESDLELISQSASATHIPYHTTPQSSCMCACGIVAIVPGPAAGAMGTSIPINEQIYRVEMIEFNSVSVEDAIADSGAHDDAHHKYLEQIEEKITEETQNERTASTPADKAAAKQKKGILENEKKSLQRVMAEHYRDEGPAVTILPRHMVNGVMHIISVGAVHYVLDIATVGKATIEGYLTSGYLHRAVVGSLQRWPVGIALDGASYLRVDQALKKHSIP